MLAPCTALRAADFFVVEARGVGMQPGQTVDSAKPLNLKEGQHLTLVSREGRTFKFDGPYDKAPDADPARGVSLRPMILALRTADGARTGDVGVTRGLPSYRLPDPWVLDASQTGKVCLREGSTVVLWRPDPRSEATLSVVPADKSWKVNTKWPAGMDRVTIPAQVPLRGGEVYTVALNGAQSDLTVMTVPAALANDDMRLAWMAEMGCLSQAEALVPAR
jgi:hypothetical protein